MQIVTVMPIATGASRLDEFGRQRPGWAGHFMMHGSEISSAEGVRSLPDPCSRKLGCADR
jgi:hypothetical protein